MARPSVVAATVAAAVVAVGAALLAAPTALAAPVPFRWMLTERLRDETSGQPFTNYSDSFHSYGSILAVGTTSYNRGKGRVMLLEDTGHGLQILATLTDPEGIIGDGYGSNVHLFKARKLMHLAVTADLKKGDGAVFLYRQKFNRRDLWELQEVYYPPEGVFVLDFGRTLHYDGHNFLINAERRYVSGPRFQVSAVNWRGTSYYQQTDGVSPMAGDPVFVYRLVEQRNNGTTFALAQTLDQASYTLDFGKSIGSTPTTLAVGGSFREALKYGHGTDGDLVVTDTYLLDGTAEYNFNSVTIRAGGTLTVGRFEEVTASGGRLTLRIKNDLFIEAGGAINLTAYGYSGGDTAFTGGQQPEVGLGPGGGLPASSTFTGVFACDFDGSTSVTGVGRDSLSSTGRPENLTVPFAQPCGGGGSYGAPGEAGSTVYCGTSGLAGGVYGDPLLNTTDLGSGGGSGFPWKVGSGGRGGNGGGSVVIYAKRVVNYGVIEANGGGGDPGGFYSGGGGGGSGGSIALVGDNLANYGSILAIGGKGGQRAAGSGYGGDETAKGGDGGPGRIRFDFLTTQSHGTVIPYPKNITTYLGDVLIYKRDNTTLLWTFFTYLPRLTSMMFVGHQIALTDNLLAVASDQGTPVNPTQRVYLFDITTLENSSSVLPFRVFPPPTPQDEKFGWKMASGNGTLVIVAEGSVNARGGVYVYQGRNLLARTEILTPLYSDRPALGDYFGNVMHYGYPHLYVQLPFDQDDIVNASANNPRLSIGNIHHYKWVRNVTGAASSVVCEFATITVNNTVNCTVHLMSADAYPTGDINELLHITPAVDYQSLGTYSFQRTYSAAGVYSVTVNYDGVPLTPFSLTVTPAVDPLVTTFSCTPNPATGSELVTCNIVTGAGTGEAIAAREFDVYVYRIEDAAIPVNGTRIYTSIGEQYLNLPSFHLVNDALATDYPTVAPSVSYVSQSNFQFSYRPWLPGSFAAYAMYKRVALKFPNPVIVNVNSGAIDGSQSMLLCPANAAPNRTYTCSIDLRDSLGYRQGDASWAAWFVNQSNINATVISATNSSALVGDVYRPIYAWWGGEGRVVVVFRFDFTGETIFKYRASFQGQDIPVPHQTRIAYTYPAVCGTYPELELYINLFESNMYMDIDTFRYGAWVEARTYKGYDSSWCDEARI